MKYRLFEYAHDFFFFLLCVSLNLLLFFLFQPLLKKLTINYQALVF